MKNVITVLFFALCLKLGLAQEIYKIESNIGYRDVDMEMCNLDVAYIPEATSKPVVVWFHGGGLTGGKKEIPQALMHDSLVIVGVEYRLSPNVDFL